MKLSPLELKILMNIQLGVICVEMVDLVYQVTHDTRCIESTDLVINTVGRLLLSELLSDFEFS